MQCCHAFFSLVCCYLNWIIRLFLNYVVVCEHNVYMQRESISCTVLLL